MQHTTENECKCGYPEMHQTFRCPNRSLFEELIGGLPLGGWAIHREGFNPPVGPMQPVNPGEHGMVTIDDPILSSKMTY